MAEAALVSGNDHLLEEDTSGTAFEFQSSFARDLGVFGAEPNFTPPTTYSRKQRSFPVRPDSRNHDDSLSSGSPRPRTEGIEEIQQKFSAFLSKSQEKEKVSGAADERPESGTSLRKQGIVSFAGLETPANQKSTTTRPPMTRNHSNGEHKHSQVSTFHTSARRPRGRLLGLGRAKRVSQGQEEEEEETPAEGNNNKPEQSSGHSGSLESDLRLLHPERGTALPAVQTPNPKKSVSDIEQMMSIARADHGARIPLSQKQDDSNRKPSNPKQEIFKQSVSRTPVPEMHKVKIDSAIVGDYQSNYGLIRQKQDHARQSPQKAEPPNTLPSMEQVARDSAEKRDSRPQRDLPRTLPSQPPPPAPPPKMSNLNPSGHASSKSKKDSIVINGLAYTRLSVIGRGGSSKVYKVMSPANSKIFAVKKVNLDQADAAAIQGYKNEIDLLRRLSGHERIINLYDSEINDAKASLLMLMECGEIDLAHILQRQNGRPIDLNFVRLYWEQMLQAVQAVHDQNIVHSDLKPANFLLVEGSLKLIDFGIAKAIGNDTTNIHRDTQVGTVNYMSPEALVETSHPLDVGNKLVKCGRPSDIWSLGCILYQMIYGKTPFSHLSMMQKINMIPDEQCTISFPVIARPNDSSAGQYEQFEVDGDLLRTMKMCLQRNQKLRPTIPHLLNDTFLNPHQKKRSVFMSGEPTAAITQKQLKVLLDRTLEYGRMRKGITPSHEVEELAREAFENLRMEH